MREVEVLEVGARGWWTLNPDQPLTHLYDVAELDLSCSVINCPQRSRSMY